MSENMLLLICFGGLIVLVVGIIVFANWMTARNNQKRANKMMEARRNGTYDPKKKYMGNQGGWEPGEGPYDWNEYNRD